MPPKDRDARATTAPPEGSAAKKAIETHAATIADPEPHHPDSFDEEDETPSEVRERNKPAEQRRATAGDVSRLEKRVSDYIDTDAREHKEIRDDLHQGLQQISPRLDTSLTTRDAKLDTFGKQLGDVVVQSAVTATHAARLVAVVDSESQAQLRLKTAQEEANIADKAKMKDFKRQLTLRILTWMTPLAALAIGAIVALIEKCK